MQPPQAVAAVLEGGSEAEVLASPAPLGLAVVELETQPSSGVWYYLRGVLSGTASGVTKLVVGHPFDTIKVRMQTEGGFGRFRGPLDCVQQTLRHEGVRGLYKGATPPLVGWSAIDSLMWGSLIQYRHWLRSLQADPSAPLSLPRHFVAGGLAGITTVVLVTPIEQVKARLQIQYHDGTRRYSGPIDCVRQLVRNNGVLRGLYAGTGGTILFRAQMSIYFGAYEVIRRDLQRRRLGLSETSISFLSGGLGSCCLWIVATPSDAIKNKMMAQPDERPRRFPTVLSCIRSVWRTEGWRGFYRGFVPIMLRSFPTNGAAFVAAETMLNILPR